MHSHDKEKWENTGKRKIQITLSLTFSLDSHLIIIYVIYETKLHIHIYIPKQILES